MRKTFALAVVTMFALVAAAIATAATVVVTPASPDGWSIVNDTCGLPTTGSASFVSGPATPPAGSGSLELTTGANGDSYPTLRTGNFAGVRLSTLTELDYSTYVSHSGSGGQAPYIDLYIDNNNDGVRDDILTFEPIYQTAQGPVTPNGWQHWNALSGRWWSDNAGGPPPFYTLHDYTVLHPDARIVGHDGFILAAGCGGAAWTDFVGNADKLAVGVSGHGSSSYDFEPTIGPPTSKDQCKKGGWQHFNNPTFKNQGQCVAYVNHHAHTGAGHHGGNPDH